MFFRMHRISDVYFVGGFGTVQWVDVGDYIAATPDQIVRSQPHQTLQVTLLTLHAALASSCVWMPITSFHVLMACSPKCIPKFTVQSDRDARTAQVLNEAHSEGLRQALSRPKSLVDDAAFIPIDRQGADVRVRRSSEYVVERLTFSTV